MIRSWKLPRHYIPYFPCKNFIFTSTSAAGLQAPCSQATIALDCAWSAIVRYQAILKIIAASRSSSTCRNTTLLQIVAVSARSRLPPGCLVPRSTPPVLGHGSCLVPRSSSSVPGRGPYLLPRSSMGCHPVDRFSLVAPCSSPHAVRAASQAAQKAKG